MSSILVTGAQGFIGRACIPKLLQAGFQVHAFSRSQISSKDNNLIWHQIDLMDAKAVTEQVKALHATHCLHTAWETTPGLFWQSPENLKWLAVTSSLATAFGESGGKRFVGIGSCAEYDWSEEILVETEDEGTPASLYGQCKAAAQRLLQSIAKQQNFSAAWARLFFMYGPHAPRVKFPRVIIESLLRGQEVKTSSGEQVRDFLHVNDVASALVKLLTSDIEGPINIASGEATRLKDMMALIANKTGRKELIRLGDVIPKNEPKALLADTRRLQTELDWQPSILLEQGLEQLIEDTKKEINYDSL